MSSLDRLDVALGIVGVLGAAAGLVLAASSFRATLFELDGLHGLTHGPDLDSLEVALLALASRASNGELRTGVLEDGSLLVLPGVAGQCLVIPSEAPLRHLVGGRLFTAQPLPARVPHGPPGVQAEVREVTLYRLTLRGWKEARESPAGVLAGELARRAYPGSAPSPREASVDGQGHPG